MDTPRTIRDTIQHRARLPKWISISLGIGLAVIAVVARIVRRLPADTRPFLGIGVLALFVIGIIGIIFSKRLNRGVSCPKCGASLGPFAMFMADTAKLKKINFCPYCAVNLDDPMPEAPASAENVTTPDKLVWK